MYENTAHKLIDRSGKSRYNGFKVDAMLACRGIADGIPIGVQTSGKQAQADIHERLHKVAGKPRS